MRSWISGKLRQPRSTTTLNYGPKAVDEFERRSPLVPSAKSFHVVLELHFYNQHEGKTGVQRLNRTREAMTGWWSLKGCLKVVFEEWIRVPTLMQSDETLAEAFRRKLTQVETAVLMEVERFVKATHILEGDGKFVLVAHEKLVHCAHS